MACASDLPTELLVTIFEYLRPSIQQPPLHSLYTHFPRYIAFCRLRLVCKSWDDILAALAYEEVVIVTTPLVRLKKMVHILERRSNQIRSVILVGKAEFAKPQNKKESEELLARSLAPCTSIRNINCSGVHFAFSNRKWLHKLAPTLASTVTNLRITGSHPFLAAPSLADQRLSISLVGLGRNLQSLTIEHWVPQHDVGPFHLPSEFPNLTHLTLHGDMPSSESSHSERLTKLLKRIASTKGTPMRHLTFSNTTLPHTELLPLLRIPRVGTRLISLHVSTPNIPSWNRESEERYMFPLTFATALLKECGAIADFSYFSRCTVNVLAHLPLTIEHLGLLIDELHVSQTSDTLSVEALLHYLRSDKGRSLITLSILVRPKTLFRQGVDSRIGVDTLSFSDVESMLTPVCKELGVKLKQTHYVEGLGLTESQICWDRLP